ncbi:MAG: ATP-binding cassette domain-containing protein [Pseudomonadota bacterium]
MDDDHLISPTRSETVLELREIGLDIRGKALFEGLSARFARGELTLILGATGSGKSRLAGLLAGAVAPDRGEMVVQGRVSPVIGQNAGLGETATLERDLGLRAAAYGLDTRAYAEGVARLVGAPGILRRSFDLASATEKSLISRASALLIPASVYLSDNAALVPSQSQRMAPLLAARRRSAAMIWITGGLGSLLQGGADRYLVLAGGRLLPCRDPLDLLDIYEAHGGTVAPSIRRAMEAQYKPPAAEDPEQEEDRGDSPKETPEPA